jgi:hypothetical protein
MRALLVAMMLMVGSQAGAEPIWDIAPEWICSEVIHTKISLDGKNKESDIGRVALLMINFTNNSVVSAFEDSRHSGRIYPKFYIENVNAGNQSVFVIDWDGFGEYAGNITEKAGSFWTSKTSGYFRADKKLWTSHRRCRPI